MSWKFNPFTGKLDFTTSPGGADTNVQYNDGGVFGGDANFIWVKATKILTLTSGTWSNSTGGAFLVTGPDTTAVGITVDNSSTNGRRYSLISTGAVADFGAGFWAIVDNTAAAGSQYRWAGGVNYTHFQSNLAAVSSGQNVLQLAALHTVAGSGSQLNFTDLRLDPGGPHIWTQIRSYVVGVSAVGMMFSTSPTTTLTERLRITDMGEWGLAGANYGTAGQALVSNGPGVAPTWTSVGGVFTPAALTRTNDTNVTVTLGGTPLTALLQATSLTLGWTGTLAPSRGGTGQDTSASTGVAQVSAGTWSVSTALASGTTATTQAQADNSTKVATTAYVDEAVLGQRYKEAVKYATTAVLPAVVYANGSSGVGATLTAVALGAISLDGVTPSIGDRILVKNQVADLQNGIYTVTIVGSVGAVFVLTRATDFDQSSEIQTGDTTFVIAGNTLANTLWAYTGINSPTMGTTSLTFAQVSADLIVGSSTILSGTTTRVLYDNAGVLGEYAISGSGSVAMTNSPTFVTPTLGVASATSLTLGTALSIGNGGTGQTTALAAFNALSVLTTRGDLLTRDASNNVRLAIGTAAKYLRTDGTDPSWQTVAYADISGAPTIPTGANPSVNVTLSVQNGVATTFMRSDAAPALDQSIVPTWSGVHTWTGTSNLFLKTAIATTYTNAVEITNTTASTNPVQVQYSPSQVFVGHAWRAGVTQDFAMKWRITNVPAASNLPPPTHKLTFASSISNGADSYAAQMTIDGAGVLDVLTSISIGGVGLAASNLSNGTTGTGAVVLQGTPTLTTPVIGVATGTSLAVTGLLTSSSASAGIGYATGAGGTATQATSRTTTVTASPNPSMCGTLTMFSAAQAANALVTFTFTNSAIASTDMVVFQHNSATDGGAWNISVVPGSGSCTVNIRNVSTATITSATPLRWCIIKAVTS